MPVDEIQRCATPDDLIELLRRTAVRLAHRGQRFTEGRRRVLSALHRAGHPMSVEDILAAEHPIAQSSAYRDIRLLCDIEVLRPRYLVDDRVHYEIADDVDRARLNMLCTSCGSIASPLVDERLRRRLDSVVAAAADGGFRTTDPHLVFHGRCRSCVASTAAAG